MIVYTSGTTGRPKGYMQTHGNLPTNVGQNIDGIRAILRDDEVTLIFLPLAILDRVVDRKFKAAFGGQLRFAFSGGVPLGERLTHFLNGVGVRIFEGYGLYETRPTLTLKTADACKPGTVGRPVAGTTTLIADDGETLRE